MTPWIVLGIVLGLSVALIRRWERRRVAQSQAAVVERARAELDGAREQLGSALEDYHEAVKNEAHP